MITSNSIKYFAFVSLILSQICVNISLKVSTNEYGIHMAFFQTQFMNIFFALMYLILMIPMQIIGSNDPGSKHGITYNERKWKNHIIYCMIGTMDSLTIYSAAIGGNKTPGDWQVMLGQLSFPFAFIISPIIFSETRKNLITCYHQDKCVLMMNIFGMLLLMLSIYVVINNGSENDNVKINTVDSDTFSVCLFASSSLFTTIGWLLREKILNEKSTSMIHLNTWTAIYAVMATFLVWPIQTFDKFGNIPMNHLTRYLDNSLKYFTSNGNAMWSELLFSIGTFIASLSATVLCKYGSATYQFSVNIVAIPISCVFFAILNLPFNSSEPLTPGIIMGLIIVIMGMLLYERSENKIRKMTQFNKIEKNNVIMYNTFT